MNGYTIHRITANGIKDRDISLLSFNGKLMYLKINGFEHNIAKTGVWTRVTSEDLDNVEDFIKKFTNNTEMEFTCTLIKSNLKESDLFVEMI